MQQLVDVGRTISPPLAPMNAPGSRAVARDWATLSREQVSRWLQYLHAERGQAPATRVNVIVAVRVYLRALNDSGLLDADAEQSGSSESETRSAASEDREIASRGIVKTPAGTRGRT